MTHPAFSQKEYDRRIALTRAAMDRAGLWLLLVTDPSNMAWLTGYDGWSFYVHQGVLLGPDGPPRFWGRGMDARGAERTVWMPDDAIHGYADDYVQNPDKHPMEDLAQLIVECGWGGLELGVEMENYYFSAAAYRTLLALDFSLTDATGLVNWERLIKSPEEIGFMRKAGRIVTEMHRTIRETAEPGMRKNDLIAEIYRAGIRGVDDAWGDYPAIVPMAPSGMDATAAHLTWDDRRLQAGEPTFFEIAGVYRRYHAPQSRTLFFGKVPDKYRRAEDAVAEATAIVLDHMVPGVTCGTLADGFNDALNRMGFQKDGRCGYSIGLSYPPDWGERTLSLRPGDRTRLAPGMTLHFMPALWLDDGGYETTEPVLITETGAERLAQTPPGLVVK